MVLKKKLINNIFLYFFFISSFTVVSQNTTKKIGNWYMYNGTHKVSEDWKIQTMAHFRYYEFSKNFQQNIYRLAVNYSFHKNLNTSIGYSYVDTDALFGAPEANIYENRIYEDINYKHTLKKLKFRHRFRFEHRFIRTNSVNKDSHWFRYDLNLNYPIGKNWSTYVFNETFFNMDKNKRFVQNWTGIGFLHKISNALKLNLGFLNIKLPSENQKRILLGIILYTNHKNKTI